MVNDEKTLINDRSFPYINDMGDIHWFDNNEHRHKVGGPAIEYADAGIFWYRHGKFHRIGGPAIMLSNGSEQWWIDGVRQPDPERPG